MKTLELSVGEHYFLDGENGAKCPINRERLLLGSVFFYRDSSNVYMDGKFWPLSMLPEPALKFLAKYPDIDEFIITLRKLNK